MKTILIPTDFSIDSLSLLKTALENEQDEKLNIVLVYGTSLSKSITDLLFFSKSSCIAELQSSEFAEAKSIVANKYDSKINALTTDFFFGNNHSAFENFVEGHNISKIYIPKSNNALQVKTKRGFDLLPFLRRSAIETFEVDYINPQQPIHSGTMSKLLVP